MLTKIGFKPPCQGISGIINNLLDNLTKANREYVDKRLTELNAQRKQLEERLRELDLLALSQVEIRTTVADTLKFISGLEYTLTQGLPQEKIVALRQCIERIWMNVYPVITSGTDECCLLRYKG